MSMFIVCIPSFCRVIWIIICVLSLVISLTLLCIAWIDFQKNPVILVTDSNHFPVFNYPFPAVVVCDLNKISKTKILALARNLTSDDGAAQLANDMRVLSHLLGYINANISNDNFMNVQNFLEERGMAIHTVLESITPNCEEMIQKCLWKGEEVKCENIFEKISCSHGHCCAFNYFAIRKHRFAKSSKYKHPTVPRRVTSCGQHTALEIIINSEPSEYFATYYPSYGHNVMLQYPYHYPDWNTQAMFIQSKALSLISISPTITYSDSIENVAIDTRQCLFLNERKLIYFTNYNYHNCMVECRMNLTKKLCGCVPYYYIQNDTDFQYLKICNLRDVKCLVENKEVIISAIPGVDFTQRNPSQNLHTVLEKCNCLPDCETTHYTAEMSSGILSRKFSVNKAALYDGVDLKNHSVVRVFYNDLVGIRNRRMIRFNWHSLFAYYGGILGLFLGFSFVSGIEFIYFFTLKLIARKSNAIIIRENPPTLSNSVKIVKPLIYDRLDPNFLKYYRESYKKNLHKRHFRPSDNNLY